MAPLSKGKIVYFYDISTDHFWKDVITFKRKPFVFFDHYQPGPNREVREGISKSFNMNFDGVDTGLICDKKINIFNEKCAAVYKTAKDVELKKMLGTYNFDGMHNHLYVCTNKQRLAEFATKNLNEDIQILQTEIRSITQQMKQLNIETYDGIKQENYFRKDFFQKFEMLNVVESKLNNIKSVIDSI